MRWPQVYLHKCSGEFVCILQEKSAIYRAHIVNANWNTLFITTAFIENLYYIGKFKTELHDHLQYFIDILVV